MLAVDPRLYEGRAAGGPLDGVKLSAPLGWNGLIPLVKKNGYEVTRYHDGHYKWHTRLSTWVWSAETAFVYCRYDAKQKRTVHHWHPSARAGSKCLCSRQVLVRKRV